MAKLRQRAKYATIKEAILGNSGCAEDDLINPAREDPRAIQNMYNAAIYVIKAIESKTPVTIIGDYDSDGLNATAILMKLFRYYGVEATPIIPRRISDGYGLSKNLLDGIQPGLVITIDNGITAVDEIQALKKKGCTVIVLDHHQPQGKLPEADVLVDPHVNPEKNGFVPYCGAGLGYQLARLVMEQDHSEAAQRLLNEMNVHAAIATITDVVSLTGANRRIVMDGLNIAKNDRGQLSAGLLSLLSAAGEQTITEDVIGFTLGPIINAPARLYNAGGASTLKALVCTDAAQSAEYMNRMIEINNSRKALVQNITAAANRIVAEQQLVEKGAPLVIYIPGCTEGVMGIIAGKMEETYQMPSFVLTDSQNEPGVLKGSGRAGEHYDFVPVLQAVRSMCVACGGHKGAMGISVMKDALPDVEAEMRRALLPQKRDVDDVIVFDVQLTQDEIPHAFSTMRQFAPFGEGNRKPVVLIRNFQAVAKFGEYFRILGADGKTLKVNGEKFDLIGFGLADKYKALGCPGTLDVVGTIGSNTYKGNTTIQIEMIDFAARG